MSLCVSKPFLYLWLSDKANVQLTTTYVPCKIVLCKTNWISRLMQIMWSCLSYSCSFYVHHYYGYYYYFYILWMHLNNLKQNKQLGLKFEYSNNLFLLIQQQKSCGILECNRLMTTSIKDRGARYPHGLLT